MLQIFSRTGTRTKLGLLMDGKNSAVRYYKNNFCDGFRQVSFLKCHLSSINILI